MLDAEGAAAFYWCGPKTSLRASPALPITLLREPGRQRAFVRTCSEAFDRSQRQARRAWRRRWHRARARIPESATVAVGVPWEDQVVTVQATFGLNGVGHVAGVPVQAGA